MTNKSPAPIDSAKVEDTGEPIYQVKLPIEGWKDVKRRIYLECVNSQMADETRMLYAAPAEPGEYKRMFGDACRDLGLINEALGLDPDDGGAEPILDAIAELKSTNSTAPTTGSAPEYPFALIRDRNYDGEGLSLWVWSGENYNGTDGDCLSPDPDGSLDGFTVEWLTDYALECRLNAASASPAASGGKDE